MFDEELAMRQASRAASKFRYANFDGEKEGKHEGDDSGSVVDLQDFHDTTVRANNLKDSLTSVLRRSHPPALKKLKKQQKESEQEENGIEMTAITIRPDPEENTPRVLEAQEQEERERIAAVVRERDAVAVLKAQREAEEARRAADEVRLIPQQPSL